MSGATNVTSGNSNEASSSFIMEGVDNTEHGNSFCNQEKNPSGSDGISSFPISSQIYTLVVGELHQTIHIHAEFLSKSDHFRAVVDGQWKEKAESRILLEDWEYATVYRFAEWLYTANYTLPHPLKPSYSFELPSSNRHLNKNQKLINQCHRECKTLCKSLELPVRWYPLPPHHDRLVTARALYFKGWLHTGLNNEDPEIFSDQLEHLLSIQAKLYVFADYTQTNKLRYVSCYRIAMILLLLQNTSSLASLCAGIARVTRYVYENTEKSKESKDPLRHILSWILAKNSSKDDKDVEDLIAEGGDMAVDVFRYARLESTKPQTNENNSPSKPSAKRKRTDS